MEVLLRQRDPSSGTRLTSLDDEVVARRRRGAARASSSPYAKTSSAAGERNGRWRYCSLSGVSSRTSASSGSVLPTSRLPQPDELPGVVVRHAEQPGEHPDREVGADLLDEVELAPSGSAASSVVAVSPRRNVSYGRERAGREVALEQPAQRRSAGAPSVSSIDLRISSWSSSSSSRFTAASSEENVCLVAARRRRCRRAG